MKILLTGASGFIGRNFLLHLPPDSKILALYHHDESFPEFVASLGRAEISAARCDLGNPCDVEELFESHGSSWDCCVYLAAKVDIPWSVQHPQDDLLANSGALLNVLEPLRAGRFLYFSSGAVYDGLKGEAHPDANLAPTLPYAISKLTCERYVEFFQQRRRTIDRYLTVRFFGAFGPYEASHKIYTRLVRNFAIDGKDSYKLYGSGQNLIDAMYVDDTVEAIYRMIGGAHWNRVVNLAGGNPLTIEALVRQTAGALGVPRPDITKEGVAHESNQFWGSTKEMRDLFDFSPKISLSEGITRFRDFLCAPERRGICG